jgi:hypothetical protein
VEILVEIVVQLVGEVLFEGAFEGIGWLTERRWGRLVGWCAHDLASWHLILEGL